MVNPKQAILFIIVFLVLQQIEGNLIYPHVVGESVGLPSIWVLAAVTIGGNLMGIVGMLVFIPLLDVYKRQPMRDTFEMAHNALKAHGRAVQMLRTYGKQKLTIGYAPTSSVCYPETDRPEDIEAARKAYFSLQEDDSTWTWNVSWLSLIHI